MTPTGSWRQNAPHRIARGFTLIELLVVIFVLGILVALVGGVARYVFREASRKETQATQTIVMTAIERYQEIAGDYPGDDPRNDDEDDRITATELLKRLKGEGNDALTTSLSEAQKDQVKRASRDILLKLDSKAMTGTTILDGFGNEMHYDPDAGLAGRPLLTSAGPDGDIHTKDDNIRSDGG